MNTEPRTAHATSGARTRLALLLAAALAAALGSACGDDAPTAPSSAAVVTFAVGSEEFRVALTTADQVAAARAAQSGGRQKIPNGWGRTVLSMEREDYSD